MALGSSAKLSESPLDHTRYIGAKIGGDIFEARSAAMIFNGIVEECGDDHVFCYGEVDESGLAHDQGGYAQQVGHERNASSLSALDMEVARDSRRRW